MGAATKGGGRKRGGQGQGDCNKGGKEEDDEDNGAGDEGGLVGRAADVLLPGCAGAHLGLGEAEGRVRVDGLDERPVVDHRVDSGGD